MFTKLYKPIRRTPTSFEMYIIFIEEATGRVNVGLDDTHKHTGVIAFGYKKNRERKYSFVRTADHRI
jgi:hypothetical protein